MFSEPGSDLSVTKREHPWACDSGPGLCSIAAIIAGVGAGSSLLSGLLGSSASSDAANAQVQAAQIASETELKMFDTTQANLAPFMIAATGQGAPGQQNALSALLNTLGLGWPGQPAKPAMPATPGTPPQIDPFTGQPIPGTGTPGTPATPATPATRGSNFGPTNPLLAMLGFGGPNVTRGISPQVGQPLRAFQASPGYNYMLQQSQDAITNAAGGRGGLGGNVLRALQGNAVGLANQDWYNYLNQLRTGYGDLTGQLQQLIGGGQNAAANLGGFSTSVGGQLGSNIIGAGNAQAAGIIGGANALSGGLQGANSNALLFALMNQNQGGGGLFGGSVPNLPQPAGGLFFGDTTGIA